MLENGLPGLVISTTSRFHTTAQLLQEGGKAVSLNELFSEAALSSHSGASGPARFFVDSPQFHKGLHYEMSCEPPFLLTVRKDQDGSNRYVECAVNCAMLAAAGVAGPDKIAAVLRHIAAQNITVHITLQADNDFYSQAAHLKSRGLPVCIASLASLEPYLPCPLDPETGKVVVSKTGLGSSAALVTSVVANVLTLFGVARVQAAAAAAAAEPVSQFSSAPWGLSSPLSSSNLIHNISQVAHGLAQGKVGSGFDVCSAAFGSIEYCRVPSASLGAIMDRTEAVLKSTAAGDAASGYAKLGRQLAALSGVAAESAEEDKLDWHYSATHFGLPRGLSIILADVAGGSETPSMVRSVLAWKAAANATFTAPSSDREVLQLLDQHGLLQPGKQTEGGEAAVAAAEAVLAAGGDAAAVLQAMLAAVGKSDGPGLWRCLAAANARVSALFQQLKTLSEGSSGLSSAEYDAQLLECSKLHWSEWTEGSPVMVKMAQLHTAFAACRRLLAEMGEKASVPIEPLPQTELANASLQLKGVLAAGVPGAGGYDALFAILLQPEGSSAAVRAEVESCWLHWKGSGITPLLLENGPGFGEPGAGVLCKTGAGFGK